MIPHQLRTRLIAIAAAAATAASVGGYIAIDGQAVAPEILLAMELGQHFESSGKHIGVPYIDKIGKGQPWTVCAGITGPKVIPGKYYTPEDCRRLELPRYKTTAAQARAIFTHWDSYNIWVRASLIDMTYNLGAGAVQASTMARLANAGDLPAACEQQTRWVYGTDNGVKTKLAGLVNRRATTRELCAEWAQTGVLQ